MGIFNCNFRLKNNYKGKYSKTIQSIILQCHCVKQLQLKSSVSSTKTKNKICVSVCAKKPLALGYTPGESIKNWFQLVKIA